MKVLFLTNIPSPYRIDFFNALGAYCNLTVLFERASATDRERSWLSGKACYFRAEYLKGFDYAADSAFCPGVIKWLTREFDVFVIGGYSTPTAMFTILALHMLGKPFVLNADGGMIRNDNKFKRWLKTAFIKKAKFYLSSGKMTSAYLQYYGANEARIFEYPFSSIKKDEIQFPGEEKKHLCRKNLGMKEQKIILSIGQFIHRKGFDVLLKSCASLPKSCGVYIVGGKPTTEYLALKENYKLENVHFIEFKNKEILEQYYCASDLFVLPTREDIWGLVVNEAMAYGLPVITTDKCVAGVELVEDYKNGFIVPVDDSRALTEKMCEILDDKVLAYSMSQNNLKKIESYTLEEMACCHVRIFDELLSLKKQGEI